VTFSVEITDEADEHLKALQAGKRASVERYCSPSSSGFLTNRPSRRAIASACDRILSRRSTDPQFIALIARSRARHKPGTGIPLAEIMSKYGVKPKAARRLRKA
jgi:hypothetical protein